MQQQEIQILLQLFILLPFGDIFATPQLLLAYDIPPLSFQPFFRLNLNAILLFYIGITQIINCILFKSSSFNCELSHLCRRNRIYIFIHGKCTFVSFPFSFHSNSLLCQLFWGVAQIALSFIFTVATFVLLDSTTTFLFPM